MLGLPSRGVLLCQPDFGNANGNALCIMHCIATSKVAMKMHCHPPYGNACIATPILAMQMHCHPQSGNAVPPAPLNLARLKRRYGENVPRTGFPPIDILHLVGTHITRLPQFLLFWLARLKRHYGETFVDAINYD
jgi:hypothetical protein